MNILIQIIRKITYYLLVLLFVILVIYIINIMLGKTKADLVMFLDDLNLNRAAAILKATQLLCYEVFISFTISAILSVFIALIITKFRKLYVPVLTLGVVLKAAPLIVILPILYNLKYFSYLDIAKYPGFLGGILISYFPTLVEAIKGFDSIPRDVFEYYKKIVQVSKLELFGIKLRFSLSHLFPALKVSIILSVVGSIVGELLIPSEKSIGAFITRGANYTDMNMYFVALIICGFVGVLSYAIIEAFEKTFCSWEYSN